MKFYLLPLVAVAALTAANTASAATAEELLQSKVCIACHNVDAKMVGPAYKEVAAKYADQDDAKEHLVSSIQNGSSGVWGPIPMPPNMVTDEEAGILADWVLSLN